jgi:hypothetical protein
VLGLIFGKDGALYVLEMSAHFSTGIAVGPDGNLYVSVNGFGGPADARAGQVVRIALSTHYQGQ